jgi:hypothetical protein
MNDFSDLVDMLDQQIAAAIDAGAAAFRAQDTAAVAQAGSRLSELHELQRDLLAVQQRWEKLVPAPADDDETAEPAGHNPREQRSAAHDRQRDGLQLRERTTAADSFDVGNVAPPPVPERRRGRTPERAFYAPILRALTALGGRGSLLAVITLVEQELQAQFSLEDLQPTPQTSELRWRNTLRWARRDLVRRGWLRDSVNKGVWEISEVGRQWLAEQG